MEHATLFLFLSLFTTLVFGLQVADQQLTTSKSSDDCNSAGYQANCSACTTNTICAWCTDNDDEFYCFDPTQQFACGNYATGSGACSNDFDLALGVILGIVFGVCFFITCIVACIIWCCTSCCREHRTVYIVPSVNSVSETQYSSQQPLLAHPVTPSPSRLAQSKPVPSTYYPPTTANSINSTYGPSQQQPVYQGQPVRSRVPQPEYRQQYPTLSSAPQTGEPPYNPESS